MATGEIEIINDEDWFAVVLTADKTYRIDLEGAPTGAGTLLYPKFRGLYNSEGTLIPDTSGRAILDVGEGRFARLEFQAAHTGTYYIAAYGSGPDTGTYRLSVIEIAGDDHPATPATTATVAVDGSATGEIESPNDRDWFAVQLEAGRDYAIDLKGGMTGDGTLANPELVGIFDAAGNPIPGWTTDDDAGTGNNSFIWFTATKTGTHYIAAGGHDHYTGTYTLSVTSIVDTADDYPADTTTTATVRVGGSATGEIETMSDRDWFAVEFTAGRTYRVDLMAGFSRGTLHDPFLYDIRDSEGNAIGGTRDNNRGGLWNSSVVFTATETGTHYIVAGGHEISIGTYTLEVEEVM